ncbi:MAG: hypothetical protein K0Q79_3556 [Flavipsychrobacter sp.]|jgi:hypothetical protein|nr:hypothetical protein [Flavipsychrobacter sp.]
MQNIIATFDYGHNIPDECKNVFHLGVRLIEKEFDTSIIYELTHVPADKKVNLMLHHTSTQEWFSDISARDIIIYKLSTHLKICLEQFSVNIAPAA